MDDAGRFGALSLVKRTKVLSATPSSQVVGSLPDDIIQFVDEIAVWAGSGPRPKPTRGKRRQMDCLRGVVQKERFVRRTSHVRLEKLEALLEENEVDFLWKVRAMTPGRQSVA